MSGPDRLYVPVVESNEVVAVDLTQLPDNAEELLDLLVSEAAPLGTWFDCARAYLQAGRIDAFDLIYETATNEETAMEVEKYFGKKPTYERIEFYLARAAIKIAQAREEKTLDTKTRLLGEARSAIQQANSLDDKEQLVHLASGILSMARGDLQQASRDLKNASTKKNNGRPNVVGYVAVAGLCYQQQQYKEALSYYRAALREFPGCPAEVRLGIAASSFKLGDLECARAAYKRVLQLDPDNADAYLGLALISFSDSNVQQGLADGLRHLLTAYQLAPTHVGVLALMAHFCLLKGEPDKALVLASAALDGADSDALRSEATTLMARAYHARGQLMEAKAEYAKACALDKKAPIPRLGMAQMYLASSQVMNAATELEEALKAAPGFFDALKILGQLLPALSRDAQPTRGSSDTSTARLLSTVGLLKDATAKQPHDYDMWEMLGELLSPTDPPGSLAAYKQALDAHAAAVAEVARQRQVVIQRHAQARQAGKARRQAAAERRAAREERRQQREDGGGVDGLFGSDDDEEAEEEEEEPDALDAAAEDAAAAIPDHKIPVRTLNNAAVLYYRAGDVRKAMELLQQAAEAMRAAAASGAVPTELQHAALLYNRARLLEASGEFKPAKALYEQVLQDHPSYVDCCLRLACMARARASHKEALAYAQSALDREGGHADALALMAQLHMERRDYEAAGKAVKKLLEDSSSKRDTYGRIAFANTNLYTAPKDKRDEHVRKAEVHYTRALDEYRGVLEAQPRNVWAANGCGAALAELGYLDAAKSIFSEVYGAMAASDGFLQIPDVLINLANCHLARTEYTDAVHLYRVALDKLEHKHHPQVLLYLARALYDSNKLPEAQACLKRAIHLAPTDYKLRFNFALTLQEWAVRTFRKERPAGDPTKLPDFQRAEVLLKEAERQYRHLRALNRERSGLEDGKLEAHISFCEAQLKKTAALLEAAQKEDYDARLRRHEQLKSREAEDLRRREAELLKQAATEETRRKRDALARAAQEKLEAKKAEWRQRDELMAGIDGGDGDRGGRKRRRGEGGGKKRRDKGGRGSVEPDFGEEEEGGEAEGGPQADGEEPEYDERAGGSSDEEEGAAAGSGEGDAEMEDAKRAGGAKRKDKKTKKRQRLRAAAGDSAAGDDGGGGEVEDLFADAELEDGDEGAPGPSVAPAEEEEDGLQDDDVDDAQQGEAPSGRKRGRRAALEDEDEEAAASQGQGAGGDGGGAGEEGADDRNQMHADLFGDDDDE